MNFDRAEVGLTVVVVAFDDEGDDTGMVEVEVEVWMVVVTTMVFVVGLF